MDWSKADAELLERPERQAILPVEAILDLLPPLEGKQLADIGAGTGSVAFAVAARVGHSGKVYGVDISEGMVAVMDERRKERGTANLETVRSTPDAILLPDATVDVALSVSCFHDYRDERTVAETARILKPKGTFLVVDWNPAASKVDPLSGPPREHRLPRRQVTMTCERYGLRLQKEGNLNQHVYWLLFKKG